MTSSRFTTPPIPNWIKALRVPGYRNIYEYELGQQNLHGTEMLFGDWSGELLLLAKDFAPSEYVENRIRAHDPMPPNRIMHEAPPLAGDPNRGVRVCSSKYQEAPQVHAWPVISTMSTL